MLFRQVAAGKLPLFALPILLLYTATFTACSRKSTLRRPQGILIQSPYTEVDWVNDGKFKANLSAHTTRSDGNLTPSDLIDRYHALGYSILAITDRNKTTYPWDNLDAMLDSENRDPAALDMIALQGCEIPARHHIYSYLNDHIGSKTENESLEAIGKKNGLAMLKYPSRHAKNTTCCEELFRTYDCLFGIELFTKNDRATWDRMLPKLLPNRPAWGYANDNTHLGAKNPGCNWNVLMLPELSNAWIRRGLREGRSYFVYAPQGHTGPHPPSIDSIKIDNTAGVISISATACTNIVWVSEGRAIHRGTTLKLAAVKKLGAYVRAELQGVAETLACTQPFILVRPAWAHLEVDAKPGAIIYPDPAHVQARINVRNNSGRPLHANVTISMGASILGRHSIELAPSENTVLPAAIPIEVINQGKTLETEIDLGPAYGEMRLVQQQHALAVKSPLALSANLPSTSFARLYLTNTLAEMPLNAQLTVSIDNTVALEDTIALRPNGVAVRHVPLPRQTKSASLMRAVAEFTPDIAATATRLESRLDFSDDLPVPRLAKKIIPDAILTDWDIPPQATLATREHLFPEKNRDAWNGLQDLAASIFWAWDGEAFCLAARVRDNTHINAKRGDSLWDGDCLQFAFMPEGGAVVSAALALTTNGVSLHQWHGPALDMTTGVRYAVTRDNLKNLTHYEVRIPFANLGMPPRPGMRFRFAAVIFDDDTGRGHKHWMQTAPGIAGDWAPNTMPTFQLAP